MGRDAKERYEAQFTSPIFAKNTEEIYRKVLKGAN